MEKDTNNAPAKKKKKVVVYYDFKEETRQEGLWHEAEKKHPWHNPPPKIKVTKKKGLYHMNIELTVGMTPNSVYFQMTEPKGGPFFDHKKWRDLMKNTSRKVLKENGPKRVIMVEKAVAYNFLSLTTISIPIHLTMEENRKDLTTNYKKEKVMLMKVFKGDYKVEPIYVDQKRLCKKRLPKSLEEYKKCSDGQGRIGSKLTINQYFEPYPPFNIPPLSWFIRGITIKTSKKLLNALQEMTSSFRRAGPPSEESMEASEFDFQQHSSMGNNYESLIKGFGRLNFPTEMGVFPGFGTWINQNSQEPPNAESASERDTNNAHAKKKKKEVVYYDYKEVIRQQGLWYEAEKKHPWYDTRPKIKVTNKKGLYHMNIELTVGTAPDTVYELMIDPKGGPFFNREKWRDLMKNTSRKVLKENGPKRVIMVEKAVAYNFLSLTTLSIPLHLTMEENRKDLTTKYKKGKVMLMKVFKGDYKVEPIYVDQKRLCKKSLPKSPEEYKKCSGGQGRIGSKLTINQYFEPYPPFNIPPLSWFIRGITIKTSKNLLNGIQEMASIARNARPPSEEAFKAREEDIVQVHNF
ncbi:hypothetical protein Bca52824_011947 [Brassica carinata]|uniref:DUF220 domain-containing protein n=1 Tax=Brassica carinata TaxID=52824 RepID=A0A8X7VVK5_BRACI|nr:hypothetical protein Bca52824_011947 [Brassica carinata]